MLKFVRKWLKKVIAESVRENFPSINIAVIEGDETENKLIVQDAIFNNSTIRISKFCKKKDVEISQCVVNVQEKTFIKTNLDEEESMNDEILETISCFVSIEDELLKLYCLVSCAIGHGDDKDFLHRNYLKEKISRILAHKPLIIDSSAKRMFCDLKEKQASTTSSS